ncbi:type IV pilin [Haloarcula sp. Atlit-7R]|nr:type IV pilin [Haloarcula sp. Atlit-7R]
MIGTILMVAVTVILAAIIGTFVLGSAGDIAQGGPLVDFHKSQNGTTVVLTHAGGDTFNGEDVYVVSESESWLGNYAGTNGQACDPWLPFWSEQHVP